MDTADDRTALVLAYHERTKHQPQRFARSPGYLDWETQPDPFRTYAGAPRVDLPLTADDVQTRYDELWTPGAVAPAALELGSLAAFFELALGLTAWKEYGGSRWALRSNPSSGNLHPTEGYAVLPDVAGVAAGVYHYVSRDHALERRCGLAGDPARELAGRLPAGGFLVGLTSIHWREAWKYGERAFRYCQHDVGHALATVRFAAAALGWSAWLLDGLGDERIARLLGLDREADQRAVEEADREHPDAVLLIAPDGDAARAWAREGVTDEVVALANSGTWAGEPNALSPSHVDWDVIDQVARATWKPASRETFAPAVAEPVPPPAVGDARAATILRQRRSAVALDGETSILAETFYAMLARVVPVGDRAPWDALPWEPRIHLGILVHRVDGLAPGLYVLERTAEVHADLVAELGPKAKWSRPADCPETLRLFCIGEGDYRRAAAAVSCGQDIAADGAFSLGMIAEFRATIAAGAYGYRRLFWETGVLGQVLYLEAEAHGVRGTGIGCYFDDAFHRLLGLEGDRFQSLYHFTVGGPVEDSRLATHPPYEHLERAPRAGS